jgi:hypothetical protein
LKNAVLIAAALAVMLAAFALVRTGTDEKPAQPSPSQAATRETAATPGEPGAIAIRVAPDSGFATLRINEAWLAGRGEAVQVQVRVACRYVPEKDQWQRIAASPTRIAYRVEPRQSGESNAEERLFYELPHEEGPFWVHWIETPEGYADSRITLQHVEIISAGRADCGTAASLRHPGQIPICVSRAGKAETRWVSDPAVVCAEQR